MDTGTQGGSINLIEARDIESPLEAGAAVAHPWNIDTSGNHVSEHSTFSTLLLVAAIWLITAKTLHHTIVCRHQC